MRSGYRKSLKGIRLPKSVVQFPTLAVGDVNFLLTQGALHGRVGLSARLGIQPVGSHSGACFFGFAMIQCPSLW